ncbi:MULTISPECIES: universal stress protein [unclassified Sporosarcina]|uniref:universal stress protein n=1 Tax=unclassified Sporosarcina TaxID=2647733 RepID=UPI00204097F8|nr:MULTISPECIES: universal stress protein [unclassified Sporosarcina]GKV65553.1 universal stress protein [Sporosarcina sp. NCCP-2331]GLB55678.1 universal stress protein [Sporosarcina sp. NCCP-2378]
MKIGVAIDGSQNALRAVEYAVKTAGLYTEAELKIIYVVDFNTANDERMSKEDTATIRQRVTQPAMEQAQANTELFIFEGDPAQKIVQYADATPLDHLVIGSRGLNAVQEMMLGSVSHKVIKEAKCPVTVIK